MSTDRQALNLFKWVCLVLAVLFALAVLALLYDLKRDVTASLDTAQATISEANEAVSTVNAQLPEILTEVKSGTETLSALAEDVELIKSVAGMQSEQAERGLRSLATYADEIQQLLSEEAAGKDAIIMIEEIFGSDLRRVSTAEEFLVGLNREMIGVILPLARSKQEILYRVTHSAPPRRKPFFIQFPDVEPVSLKQFIGDHHPESANLPPYEPD